MPRRKAGLELEALKRQQDELAKRIKEAEAKHRHKQKADDERRCQLAGAVALDHAEAEPKSQFAKTLTGLLNAAIRNAADRALFDLPPPPKQEPKATEPAAEDKKPRRKKPDTPEA